MKDLEELSELVLDMSEWLDRYSNISLTQDSTSSNFWEVRVCIEGGLFEEFMFDDFFELDGDTIAIFVEFDKTPEEAVKKMLCRFKLIDYYMKHKVFGDGDDNEAF